MADILDACVAYGTHVAVVVTERPKGGFADGTVGALFRHFLELLDAIALLVRHVCADAAKPLARSALETSLSLEYLLQKDTEQRAIAYQVAHAHRRISLHRNLNPRTDQGKNFRAKVQGDPMAKSILNMDPTILEEREASLFTMLARPEFAPVEASWKSRPNDNWFSLFGGPRGIEALAQHLHKAARYEVLYRSWSESTHATGSLTRISVGPGNTGALLALRFPGDMQQVTLHVSLMAIDLMRIMIRAYVPGEEVKFAKWYSEHLSSRVQRLYGPALLTIE